jgi:hypothetical protein
MAYPIHASMLAVKDALLDPSVDPGRTQPDLQELLPCDKPMLASRYRGHLLVR